MTIMFDPQNNERITRKKSHTTASQVVCWLRHRQQFGCYVLAFITLADILGDTGAPLVSWCADVGVAMRQNATDNAQQKKIFEQLKKVSPSSKIPDVESSLRFYRAVLFMATGDESAYEKLSNQLQQERVFEPELLLSIIYGDAIPPEKRLAAESLYADYCPLSTVGRDRDDRSAPVGKIRLTPPSVPSWEGLSEKLSEIGDLYAKGGYLREAVDAYLESIYSTSPTVPRSALAQKWMRVGELESACGQPRLAVRAYLKAAYHDAAFVTPAVEGINKVLQVPVAEKKVVAQPTLDGKTALTIARLYRELNLHPFALKVLDAVQENSGGNVNEQRKALDQEWASIVEAHRRIRGNACVLLGMKVAEVKNWATVLINRPSDTFWKPEKTPKEPTPDGVLPKSPSD